MLDIHRIDDSITVLELTFPIATTTPIKNVDTVCKIIVSLCIISLNTTIVLI